jgi:pimeloyl-ACP methyl ester carboxylesterase
MSCPGFAAAQQVAAATTPVSIEAPDGTLLKATYFSSGRPGPGILLLHQCNRDRTSWTPLAAEAAERGYHVLAFDYRGYGQSGGQRFESFQEQGAVIQEKWPGDVDAAFTWLTSQAGVDRNRIAAAGASCGVNQSLLLGSRHPEVKTLVLLSGGATPEAREYLRRTPGLPVFAAASLDDGNIVDGMRWILSWSRNPKNTFTEFRAAGHGTEMFAVEKGLQPMILDWFDGHLRNAPATLPASTATGPPTPVEEFWTALTRPGGVDEARRIYDEARRRDPKIVLFPEGEANAYGYELLQGGDVKGAIQVFQLNVDAYPTSANTYDSLSDAQLAAGNREESLRLAEKALSLLEADTQIGPELRAAIRESAEKKIRDLRK